ncbi:dTDP-3,4-didehydro-2,6-dideoxy-alpha-D-glucose 3-reductase [Telopea speciosissima]|uniref:dTDP-3,4-didehydro-2,6-dideoxy-alpha-D-glucose 3-reductase n=1 Tax=Telopea speciosissima TaxID=54955 RepID=UPI001CC35BA6|nr:dTDP-3,4-didehydro-2,6-dideoxy-alpha-D-glucose 3-reductase [Telopea speciosissima]XP_043693569.1 dTDP-3,4-didehydro-2,6-dideoxy-alpha-D-glucose 3-reductase [Telopea speciosissima]XP_043693570.1 dTDP-3,4-didehydro-2,6-dideoxy-alpha-D-glucose 3-reductase [Telopea speciosissima]XP_043693571.1 dTDP-3,4-didehydro-2,6-dideoxy-alpha-D-glucose 3-reductase [Telopea speciosissima]XP_043693572.1 dTDP-3,4-didehydro-2,6-dideoxy-alpha-D-glucose 3-reductase [Telopea speciosissima]
MTTKPHIAVLGAGIFVRTQYIPRLSEIADIVDVRAIWSRSEESARAAVELARKFFPNIECKWGDEGLDGIIRDSSILGVAVVLAGQTQVDISLRLLKAGKHILQEKPAAVSNNEAETAISSYNAFFTNSPHRPIWAVAENYRFEPAFVKGKKLINDVGEMMSIQLIVEGSMNSSNPYFSSSWRRNFTGGFILDMGVHFIAGLRMVVGCEVASVSAITSHVDMTLPPPDNICSLFQLENGCAGVFVMAVSSSSPKIFWRVVGSKGTLQIDRGSKDGKHGYSVSLYTADGHCQSSFHPFCGVNEELKSFIHDISQAALKEGGNYEAEPRSSFVEGARDIAVLEAMLESGMKQGAQVNVKKF